MLLQVLCGSHAYGTNTPESDMDWHGVFAEPPGVLDGLFPPSERDQTWSEHGEHEDFAFHEAGKFCRLALKCNPTMLEVLWAADDDRSFVTGLGDMLVQERQSFLSAPSVRNSYLGFMNQQVRLVTDRHTDPNDRRRAKHAKHILRLMECGKSLWTTGDMSVRVSDPDAYHAFGEACARDTTNKKLFDAVGEYESVFDSPTVLPEEPDGNFAKYWLSTVRRAGFNGGFR
jgi:hypothetical protein